MPTIRAAVSDQVGAPLRVETLDLAGPGAGEVLVRTHACAICHSDVSFLQGKWGEFAPTVFGHEIAGVVEEAGQGVSRVKPGDRVLVSLVRSCGGCRSCRLGHPVRCEETFALDRQSPLRTRAGATVEQGLRCAGFADHVMVHASQVMPIPDDVRASSAAVIACAGITGIGAVLNTADMPPGRRAVVIGAGGVGLNAIQGAALRDPEILVAVDVAPDKLRQATAFGASEAVDASREDATDRVRELTGGRGADFVFVTVGAPAAVDQALALAARGGTVVLVGMPATGERTSFEPSEIAAAEIRILGSKMGSADLERDVPRIFDWVRRGRLRFDALVTQAFSLDDINPAVAAAQRPENVRVAIDFEVS